MTERVLSQVQATETGYLPRVHGATLHNKVRSCEFHKTWNVEKATSPKSEISVTLVQLSYQNVPGKAGGICPMAAPTGKLPKGRTRTRWNDHISNLDWSHLGVEPAELSEIAENRGVFRVLLGLLPWLPFSDKKRVCQRMNDKHFFPNFLGALFIKSTEMNPSRTVSNETLSTWKIWPYLSLTLCQGKPRNSGEGLSRIRSEIPRVIITPEKNSPINRVSLLIDGLWQTDNFSVI